MKNKKKFNFKLISFDKLNSTNLKLKSLIKKNKNIKKNDNKILKMIIINLDKINE